jgi:hypothetical protein
VDHRVKQDYGECKAPLEHKAHRDQLEILDRKVRKVKVYKAQQDRKDRKVPSAIRALLGHKVPLVRECKDHKVKLDRKDHKGPLDHKGIKVQQGQWVLLAVRVRKEPKVHKVHKVHKDLVRRVHKVHKVQLAVATYPDHKVHKGLGQKLLYRMKVLQLPVMFLL